MRSFVGSETSFLLYCQTRGRVSGLKHRREVIERNIRQSQTLDFSAIAVSVHADDDFEQATVNQNAAQGMENVRLASRDRAQQTAPGKVYVNLVGDLIQFVGKIFDWSLDEQNVRRSAFCGFPSRPHRNLLQRLRVGVDPDVEPRRILSRALVYKATVAGPDIHYHAAGGKVR